mmetsp:Transcript_55199/g.176911  ORF Transcript_55199/g.176911 Transcript_55199/m.176911 type:complete len:336 (-) Transcript_55199:10-1017(-)
MHQRLHGHQAAAVLHRSHFAGGWRGAGQGRRAQGVLELLLVHQELVVLVAGRQELVVLLLDALQPRPLLLAVLTVRPGARKLLGQPAQLLPEPLGGSGVPVPRLGRAAPLLDGHPELLAAQRTAAVLVHIQKELHRELAHRSIQDLPRHALETQLAPGGQPPDALHELVQRHLTVAVAVEELQEVPAAQELPHELAPDALLELAGLHRQVPRAAAHVAARQVRALGEAPDHGARSLQAAGGLQGQLRKGRADGLKHALEPVVAFPRDIEERLQGEEEHQHLGPPERHLLLLFEVDGTLLEHQEVGITIADLELLPPRPAIVLAGLATATGLVQRC